MSGTQNKLHHLICGENNSKATNRIISLQKPKSFAINVFLHSNMLCCVCPYSFFICHFLIFFGRSFKFTVSLEMQSFKRSSIFNFICIHGFTGQLRYNCHPQTSRINGSIYCKCTLKEMSIRNNFLFFSSNDKYVS